MEFVCPRCRRRLRDEPGRYRCPTCPAEYPVVAGIPDFRIQPDPWIDLAADRAKAERVERETVGMDFPAAVRAYWRITPDTPRELADVYIHHVLTAQTRSAEWLDRLPPQPTSGPWLDLGCGTGDLLAVMLGRDSPAVGVDIALRWLVVARKRPELADAPLVCACAEALPFPDAAFARIVALGLLEHCASPDPVCREVRRVLQSGGDFRFRTVNRYTLLREPHVRVWGVGFVPRRLADRYVRWMTGRGYRHHRPLSARELRGALRRAGLSRVTVGAASVLPTERDRLGPIGRGATPLYTAVSGLPGLGHALTWVAPLLEGQGTTP